ncbi:MAG TPA: universal stress protein [Dehalococcoidia bacterium]|nr:universal stress protein [Dehalococcoidia bacterium]
MVKLVANPTFADVKDVLVVVDGSQASVEAVELACRLARRRKGGVYATYVIEVERSLPLDAELAQETTAGEEALRQAKATGKRYDHHVEVALLQARDAAQALVSEAMERGVDAIIMGIDYERPYGEFQLQRIALQLLKHAPCQVWICRRRLEET